ncbi:MAG: polyphosphate kinase 1 [Spirochaetaceae bacterium]|nr:polyphosphate kinase 1 [Spirochaetaceae bacterium]
MKKTSLYFNRELSWIEFNARVLYQACRKDIPIIERLKFLAIVSSNFDEFFMVRVAGLKNRLQTNPEEKDLCSLTPSEQLKLISKRVHEITDKQYSVLVNEVIPELAKVGIQYVPPKEFTVEQKNFTQSLFQREIFPLLTPLRTDSNVSLHMSNLRLHAAFKLMPLPNIEKNPLFSSDNFESPIAVVQVPASISRIVQLPSETEVKQFALLDDIIAEYGTLLFPGYSVLETMLFKVTLDADFAVNEESDINFIHAMEDVLEKRKSSVPVRMICTKASSHILEFLKNKLNLLDEDVYQVSGIIDPSTLLYLADLPEAKNLSFPEWKHFMPSAFLKPNTMWDVLKQEDMLLHVPYHSFEPVLNFLNAAADDSKTLAIKMTLYRTSGDSPVIKALERAARNGKQVTVFVELKARFDEKRNISWATQLEKAGVIVVYGIVNLKVHGKVLLVVRKEKDKVIRYVHLGTGNYNDKTAKFYVDMSLFTCNQDIANDTTLFFNVISGYSVIQPMKKLVMAPINLKSRLLELIDREISISSPDSPGLIMAKINSLAHQEIIEALYKASCAGVNVLLNIRGICMLVPGIPNQSERIKVVSIVGRYLEHTRIFYFQNGGREELYLSSSDLMPRNLDRRIELMFPITQEDLFQKVKEILQCYFKDNTNAHQLNMDGSWTPVATIGEDEEILEKFSVQDYIYSTYKKKYLNKEKTNSLDFVVRRRN